MAVNAVLVDTTCWDVVGNCTGGNGILRECVWTNHWVRSWGGRSEGEKGRKGGNSELHFEDVFEIGRRLSGDVTSS